MSKRYHFIQADVFTHTPFGGNQLAVFTDAQGLSAEDMQMLAREMNFSESTFVLPPESPGAVKRVRIFTPAIELPLAGHPTVGTTYVLAQRGYIPLTGDVTNLVFDMGVGPVKVSVAKVDGGDAFIWMTHPEAKFSPAREDRAQVAAAIGLTEADLVEGLPIQVGSTGVPFLFIPVRSLAAMRQCRSEASALRNLFIEDPVMVYMFTTETTDAGVQIHSRMFGPHVAGITEDPATGVAAGPLGAYIYQHGVLPRQPELHFIIEQGVEMGRPSQIHVEVKSHDDFIRSIRIGGQAVIVGEGHIFW